MAEIFISYAREDVAAARRLAAELERRGWSVFSDRRILAGRQFADVIAEELDAAKCVIVFWSKASNSSDWVLDEAFEALKRNVLVPALLEAMEPPMGFRRIQAANLIGWNGADEHEGFEGLIEDVVRHAPTSSRNVASEAADSSKQSRLEFSRALPPDTPRIGNSHGGIAHPLRPDNLKQDSFETNLRKQLEAIPGVHQATVEVFFDRYRLSICTEPAKLAVPQWFEFPWDNEPLNSKGERSIEIVEKYVATVQAQRAEESRCYAEEDTPDTARYRKKLINELRLRKLECAGDAAERCRIDIQGDHVAFRASQVDRLSLMGRDFDAAVAKVYRSLFGRAPKTTVQTFGTRGEPRDGS